MQRSIKPLHLWLLRLFIWDVVMVIVVWSAPFLGTRLFPNHIATVEEVVLALFVISFITRFKVGKLQIKFNQSQQVRQSFQVLALCVALVVLFLVDFVIFFSYHKGGPVNLNGYLGCLIVYSIYFFFMAIAMYPGLDQSQEE